MKVCVRYSRDMMSWACSRRRLQSHLEAFLVVYFITNTMFSVIHSSLYRSTSCSLPLEGSAGQLYPHLDERVGAHKNMLSHWSRVGIIGKAEDQIRLHVSRRVQKAQKLRFFVVWWWFVELLMTMMVSRGWWRSRSLRFFRSFLARLARWMFPSSEAYFQIIDRFWNKALRVVLYLY